MFSIAGKEILENVRSYRFAILTALLGVLMFISILVSYGDYQIRLENYNALKPQQPTPEKVIIPPSPLSIFVKGLDSNLGRLYQLSALGIDVQVSQQSVNRLFTLFTVPDMLFVIKVMLALIALLFSFDAVSAEKEQGTLKLLLSSGAGRLELMAGKLLGRFALVFAPFLVFFLVAVAFVSAQPDVPTGSDYGMRLACLLLFSALYVLTFTAMGILISTLVHRSSTSVIVSLAAWTLFVFIIPSMGISVSRAIAGVPPGERVEMENRLAMIQAIYERIQKEKTGASERVGLDMVNQIWGAQREVSEKYRPRLNSLIGLTRSIVRTSPAGSLTFLMTDVAGTGLQEDLKIKDAILLYLKLNFNKFIQLEPGQPDNFSYNREGLPEAFAASVFIDGLVILIFACAGIVLASMRFATYDPR